MSAGIPQRQTWNYRANEPAGWGDILRSHLALRPDALAYEYCREDGGTHSVTYTRLEHQARAIGGFLHREGLQNRRVLLFYEPGLDYVTALFGCLLAGAVAVPLYPPKRRAAADSIRSIAANAEAEAILTTPLIEPVIRHAFDGSPELANVRYLTTAGVAADTSWQEPSIGSATPALIQYTSGSTGDPRGVVLTHGNLLENQRAIQQAFAVTPDSKIVSWLPLYHDMGLIGGVLQPVFSGASCLFMAPTTFLRRPVRWLQTISRSQATVSGGPNFAFDLCVDRVRPEERAGLSLGNWTVAFNGSEPVRPETLERFADAYAPYGFKIGSFRPCYGLAEATLLVAAKWGCERPAIAESGVRAVSCGSPGSSQRVAIVDPENGRPLPPDSIGEVWTAGPNIAAGYWNKPEETRRSFEARSGQDGPFLRTGDLGFVRNGELYITGRLKDLMIVNGRNVYPQDVERAAESSHPALGRNCCAAFAIRADGRERVVIVQEYHERAHATTDLDEVARAIRAAVGDALEIRVHTVVLVKPGAVPKTTSGKVRRAACRQAYLDGALAELRRSGVTGGGGAPDSTEAPAEVSARRAGELLEWLRAYAAERINSRLMDERRSIPPHIVLDFGNRGILGMQVPEAYGGLGLRNRDVVRVVEQLAGIDLTLALFVGNHNALGLRPIQQFGRPELRSRLLPRLAQGRELASFALTEPGAGSNPRAIAAKATRDAKGGWRLNGTKLWIGSASWAGVINVFARISDASPELSGTAAFAVPQGAQGLRHGPEALTMGMRGMVQNAIYLNDVFLSDDHQLGESGAGLDIAQDAMMFGRLGLGATAAGGIKRCAQLMLRYAGRRSISTGRLLDNPVTLSRLTSTVAAADAVGRLVYRTAEFLDQGLRVPNEVLLVSKIAGTEYLWRAADDLVQLLGARGYLENNIAAQLLRDARVFRIFEGPTETLQSFLGASVLHGSAELHRFLAETLNAPDVVERLRAAVERIQANDADRADSFEDRTAMQRWTHYRAGSLACLAILLAFARAPEEAPAARGRRTEEWLESQFRHELAGAIEAGQPFPLRPDDLNRVVGGYADSIGDIEQSLPGEDQALDWLLRREAPAPPKQARPLLVAKSPVEPVKPAPNQSAALVSPDSAPGRRPTQSDIEKWLRAWLVREARVPAAMVAANRPFVDFGLDSTTAIMLIADLEDFLGTRFETTLAWDYPTISSLAAFVASRTRSEDRHES